MTVKKLKSAVALGGGEWVGIQEGEGLYEDLVLFNEIRTGGRRTHGSTMALKRSEVTTESVRAKIESKANEFAAARKRGQR